jgi:hypothetical protein
MEQRIGRLTICAVLGFLLMQSLLWTGKLITARNLRKDRETKLIIENKKFLSGIERMFYKQEINKTKSSISTAMLLDESNFLIIITEAEK